MKIPAGAKFNLKSGQWESGSTRSKYSNGMSTQIRLAKGLGPNQRGVILPSPAVLKPNGTGFSANGTGGETPMVPSAVFFFFDIVDSPSNTLVSIDEISDPNLERDGLLVRSQVYGSGQPSYDWMTEVPYAVLQERLAREPGNWSIWSWPHQPAIPDRLLTPDLAFRLSIEGALLLPDASVPYEDALEFKDRYKNELRKMHRHVDKLCLKISKTGFDPLAIRIEKEEFEDALAAYLDKAKKSNIPKVLGNFDVSMNWSSAIVDLIKQGGPAAAGLIAGNAVHASLTGVAAVIGATTLAQLSVSSTFGGKTTTDNPFAYRVRLERQFN